MSDFLNAIQKTEPEILEGPKKDVAEQVTTMSFQDMKDYFDAMKENLINSLKKDMDEYYKLQNNKLKNEEGGQENASSTDLQCSEQDS